MKKALPLAAALLLTLTLVPTAAHAAVPVESDPQAQVDVVLDQFPGGEQIGPRTISWDDGAILLELAPEGLAARSISTCPTGRYCAWAGVNFTGNKLSFSGCTFGGWLVSLAPLTSGAKSFANARSTGAITVLNGSTTVYALSAGASGNYGGASTHIRCYT